MWMMIPRAELMQTRSKHGGESCVYFPASELSLTDSFSRRINAQHVFRAAVHAGSKLNTYGEGAARTGLLLERAVRGRE
jgi:hypothetical protein